MNVKDFIANLDNPFADFETVSDAAQRQDGSGADGIGFHTESKPPPIEIAIDAKTGRPRQAGADLPEGHAITEFREAAERSLYVFTKGILARSYLSPRLHIGISEWAAGTPPYRKLILIPRKHAKTSMISHGLPIHMHIQPREHNIYLPGKAGVDTRILLSGETEQRASNNLGTIEQAWESNRLLRGLWPHCIWEIPRKEARKWNSKEMVLPRNYDYPDPSVQAIGVGGAITGARFDAIIKDDLISLEAANSVVVMETAIQWHLASRALFDSDNSLEFIIGTRWAVHDLYDFIMNGGVMAGESFDADYTVDVHVRSIVEDGECIYPEKFSLQRESGKIAVVDLQKEHGSMFPLLYMNSATDPSLVDFDMEDVREFKWFGDELEFEEDERDALLREKMRAPAPPPPQADAMRGMKLNKDTYDLVFARNEYMRLRAR